ncbi:MAG: peptidoglycan-binding protein [Cocleimonas sp.]|nr:peptidoglycan-binding protein [Cocleimonas sp.]
MKNAHQLSIATLVMAGFIASGCSQQQVAGGSGASQVAGASQAQNAGGASQQMASQSQIQTAPKPEVKTVIKYKTKIVTKTVVKKVCSTNCAKPPRRSGHFHAANRCTKSVRHNHKFNNARHTHRYSCSGSKPRSKGSRYTHTHRAIPGCTKSVRHTHKFNSARHSHKYGCRKQQQVRRPAYRPPARPTYRAPARGNKWTHGHAANRCTKSIRHTHKYKNSRHSHRYSCSGKRPVRKQSGHAHRAIPNCTDSYRHNHRMNNKNHSHKYSCRKPQGQVRQVHVPKMTPKSPVDVHALQRKLKAKGYYKGPIDGIVGSGTRGALQRFMQNRR